MNESDMHLVPLNFSLNYVSVSGRATVSPEIHNQEELAFFSWLDSKEVENQPKDLLNHYRDLIMMDYPPDAEPVFPGIKEAIQAEDMQIELYREAYHVRVVFSIRRADGKVLSTGFSVQLPDIYRMETYRDMKYLFSMTIHNFILFRLKDNLQEVRTSGYSDGNPGLPETNDALPAAYREMGKGDKDLEASRTPHTDGASVDDMLDALVSYRKKKQEMEQLDLSQLKP